MKIVAKRILTALALGFLFFISFIYFPPIVFSLLLVAILCQILLFEWKNLFNIKDPLFWLIMPLYPILPFAMLIALNQTPAYRELLLILFIIISSFDMGSYVAGKLTGKHKIAPTISPGKTWEGFLGGCITATITLKILLWAQQITQPWWLLLGATFIICIFGVCGDLFESWLKRRAHVKDSGNILPGHGGFLDRFDGILFAILFFYLLRDYLIQIFS